MTVSCQAQNFTIVPHGMPLESQRVFLQNNRITELRVGSFAFGTQVRKCMWALYMGQNRTFNIYICKYTFQR